MALSEVYRDQPAGSVTAGGTTVSDTALTVTVTNPFPTADNTAVPPTAFRIIDKALPSEIMLVTNGVGTAGAGKSWTVARAQEGSAGVIHSSPWDCVQIISRGSLESFKRNESAAITSVQTVGNTVTETALVQWTPGPADQPAPGVMYEFNAFGTIGTTSSGTTAGSLGTLSLFLRWGAAVSGTLLCQMVTGINGSALVTSMGNAGFWLEGYVNCLDSTHMVAGLSWSAAKPAAPPTFYSGIGATGYTSTATNINPALAGVVIAGTGPLTLSAKWSSAMASNTLSAGGTMQRVQL